MQKLSVFSCRKNLLKGDINNAFKKIIEESKLVSLELDHNDLSLVAGYEILAAIMNSYDIEHCSLEANHQMINAL